MSGCPQTVSPQALVFSKVLPMFAPKPIAAAISVAFTASAPALQVENDS
jgi:hypothetical protein